MLDILTRRQQYEFLPDSALYNEVRAKKGITKNDFARVIGEAMIISIPPFDEIDRMVDLKDEKYQASFEYTRLMSDSQAKSESFTSVFGMVRQYVCRSSIEENKSAWQFANEICDQLYSGNNTVKLIYNRMYICVLTICILINEMRKS